MVQAYQSRALGDKEELSTDAKAALLNDKLYVELKDAVEMCGDSQSSIVRAMLKSRHAAGILSLNGKFAPERFWKEPGGARTESAADARGEDASKTSVAGPDHCANSRAENQTTNDRQEQQKEWRTR